MMTNKPRETIPKPVQHVDSRGARSPTFPAINMNAIADRVGVSRAQVSRVLNGKSKGAVDVLMGIAKELGVTVEELVAMIDAHKSERKVKG